MNAEMPKMRNVGVYTADEKASISSLGCLGGEKFSKQQTAHSRPREKRRKKKQYLLHTYIHISTLIILYLGAVTLVGGGSGCHPRPLRGTALANAL